MVDVNVPEDDGLLFVVVVLVTEVPVRAADDVDFGFVVVVFDCVVPAGFDDGRVDVDLLDNGTVRDVPFKVGFTDFVVVAVVDFVVFGVVVVDDDGLFATFPVLAVVDFLSELTPLVVVPVFVADFVVFGLLDFAFAASSKFAVSLFSLLLSSTTVSILASIGTAKSDVSSSAPPFTC